MDIQRDEVFEEAYNNICKPIIARPYPRSENGEYFYKEIHEAYLMWQAAKSQVPEGFVLVPKEPTAKMIDSTWDMEEQISWASHNMRNELIYKAMIEAQEQK